jgi:hypothetical protein
MTKRQRIEHKRGNQRRRLVNMKRQSEDPRPIVIQAGNQPPIIGRQAR